MPLYDFSCPDCGDFEKIANSDEEVRCPHCGKLAHRKLSVPSRIIVNHGENLPYGNKSRGRMVTTEKGTNILIPSWGALEKEEIDYIAEVAIEKDKNEVRISPQKKTIGNLVALANRTPRGKRSMKIREALKEAKDG